MTIEPLTTLPEAETVWRSPNSKWGIERYVHHGKHRLVLVDEFYTYYPTFYPFKPRFSEESIGWDTVIPPKYVRRAFIKAANQQLEEQQNND